MIFNFYLPDEIINEITGNLIDLKDPEVKERVEQAFYSVFMSTVYHTFPHVKSLNGFMCGNEQVLVNMVESTSWFTDIAVKAIEKIHGKNFTDSD